jgi:RNA polymerase sigma factor (sigma-70 family)
MIGSDFNRAKKAMSYLNDDYQNVLIWRYLDSMEVLEIAKLLGRSEEATRVVISRALKQLREKMEEA